MAIGLNNLAQLLSSQVGLHDTHVEELSSGFKGNYVEAEKLQREAMRIRKEALGEQHPLYASGLNNLAELLRVQVRTAGFCC